ncbi:hypothetical protein BGW80DRAFT_1182080 [Lactifluus volemus]|nr:hypothetical protein BGW80DRAFT_1182080 [Lactifluus volemus]
MTTARPKLPSVLPSQPAVQDVSTTKDQINTGLARATNPQSVTPIFICALNDCNRLFPSRERIMLHRKRDHDSEDDKSIISWNE